MKFVAITQKVRLLVRASTLSCRVEIHGILKHTKLTWAVMPQIVCFRMLITEKQKPWPLKG